jgi:hypothetical protein
MDMETRVKAINDARIRAIEDAKSVLDEIKPGDVFHHAPAAFHRLPAPVYKTHAE